jgi:hypothetical protein
MYTKITVALTFMGPDWWLKLAIEQLYQDGLRNINLSHVLKVRGLHCKDTIPKIRYKCSQKGNCAAVQS